MEKKVFGEFLGKLRVKHNMTQEQLAIHLNVTNKTISKWERGITLPDLEMIIDIADFFHLSTYELVHGIEIKHPLIRIKDKIKITNKKSIKKIAIKNLLSLLAIVMFFIGTIFCYVYTFKNYGNVEIYELYSDDENYNIKGLLVKNKDIYYLSINNINLLNKKINFNNIDKIKYRILYENIFNIVGDIEINNVNDLNQSIDNIKILSYNKSFNNENSSLQIIFKYLSTNKIEETNTLKINLKKIS